MTTLGQGVRQLVRILAAHPDSVDAPNLTAWLLLGRVLGLSREAALLAADRPLPGEAWTAALALAQRRVAGEPLAYILGQREFYGLDLAVSPAVLIPRPETECLVDLMRQCWPADAALRFVDLGTGSGAIGLALAASFPESRGLLLDVSPAALAVARGNARRHGLDSRLLPVLADMRAAPLADASLDLLVSNPPYVTAGELAALHPGVRDFEPQLALLGGPEGLDFYAPLADMGTRTLRPGGLLAVEMGASQGAAVRDILLRAGYAAVRVHQDLAGLDRIVTGWLPL